MSLSNRQEERAGLTLTCKTLLQPLRPSSGTPSFAEALPILDNFQSESQGYWICLFFRVAGKKVDTLEFSITKIRLASAAPS